MPKPKKQSTKPSKSDEQLVKTIIKMLEENDDGISINDIPSSCKLTMKDVKEIVNNGKKLYVIEPQSYETLTLLDSDNEMFADRSADGVDERGYDHIGWFYGKELAGSGSGLDEWIVINQELSDYVIKKNVEVKALEKMANERKVLVKLAHEFNALIKQFRDAPYPDPLDEDEWIGHNREIVAMLSDGIKKLESKMEARTAGGKKKYGPRVPSCECKRSVHSKYTTRPGPPYPANDCRGQEKQGNNGTWYVSTANVNGVYSWRKSKSKT